MSRDALVKKSKKVSWLLRHGAPSCGVAMDEAGWVAIADVLKELRMSREDLDAVVQQNDKARFEVDGDHIRACQGHSTGGGAVSLDALEASWRVYGGDGPLWHGTGVAAVPGIAREGILPIARTHVHLAAATNSKVGKRAQVDVLLEVSPARLRAEGLTIFESPNGVLLVRRVPPGCIVGLVAATEAGRAKAGGLRGLLGVSESA